MAAQGASLRVLENGFHTMREQYNRHLRVAQSDEVARGGDQSSQPDAGREGRGLLNGLPAWSALLRRLRSHPELTWLARVPDEYIRTALIGPLCLASWMERFIPDLASSTSFDVSIVVSRGRHETTDGGGWYQLIPVLLGCERLRLNVSLLTLDEGPLRSGLASWLPERYVRARMLDSVASNAVFSALAPESILAMFSLDFLSAQDLLRTVDCCLSHKPAARLALGSNSMALAEQSEWIFAQHGAVTTNGFAESPFAGVARIRPPGSGDQPIPAARVHCVPVLWEARLVDPLQANANGHQLERYLAFDEYVKATAEQDGMFPEAGWLGKPLFARDEHVLVGLPIRLLVDLTTGHLYAIDPEEGEDVLVEIDAGGYAVDRQSLANYPHDTALPFECALWSAVVAQEVERRLVATSQEPHDLPQAGLLATLAAEIDMPGSAIVVQHLPTPGAEQFFSALARGAWNDALNELTGRPELVHAADGNGRTALFYLVDRPIGEVSVLWALGANSRHIDNSGYSLIHEVAKRGSGAVAHFLLARGVDPNVVGPHGWSACLIAAVAHNLPVLRELLAAGARTDVLHNSGVSVEQIADALCLPDDIRVLLAS